MPDGGPDFQRRCGAMTRIACLATLLLLAGCAHRDQNAAPEVKTQIVNVAVPQPCRTDEHKQRPVLMTTDQIRAALAAAPNVDSKAQIVMSQLVLYMGWLPVVESAIDGCSAKQNGDHRK